MTENDLKFLKRAEPAALLALTNGIPWPLCAGIKVALTKPEQFPEAVKVEQGKWVAAGAIAHEPDVVERWLKERSDLDRPCDECGGSKYSQAKPEKRFTFTRQAGFGWHYLCAPCLQDFDCHHDTEKWLKAAYALRERWQGRCLTHGSAAVQA